MASYLPPTIGDFKAQFVRDFPYATPLAPKNVVVAEATANLNASGEVASITVVDGGSGYSSTQTPSVILYGGGGLGAAANAVVTSGVITGFTMVKLGAGYRTPPSVYVASGGDNTNSEKVTDYDLARAITMATGFNVTQELFSSQAAYTTAYCLLAAHYLCETLLNSASGLSGRAEWLTQSKTVGNVTESFSIPQRVINSPYLSKLSKTTYGAQFLELVSPQLVGNFQSFHRTTLP